MKWEKKKLIFEEFSEREEIQPLLRDHYKALGYQGEAYVDEKMDFSSLYHIAYDDVRIGFFAYHKDGSIVNYFLDVPFRVFDVQIYSAIRKKFKVERADVPGFDLQFLGPALIDNKKVKVLGFYFFDKEDIEPIPPKEGLVWRKVDPDEKEKVLEVSGKFFDPIDYAMETCELHFVYNGEEVAAIGIIVEQYYAGNSGSVGMFVSENYRKRGYGKYVVCELKRMCKARGLTVSAGCAVDNIASRRTLESAGFIVKAVQLEVTYK